MLASSQLIDAMNAQIGKELGASLQYLAIAAYFDGEDLKQLTGFFYRQADEEREHAMKIFHFILEVDGKIEIPDIARPQGDFSSAEECARLSLAWEEEVTRQIYHLVDLAQQDGNYIAQRFLDWFVNEQREEVSTMKSLLNVIQRAGEKGLFWVEDYLVREQSLASPEVPA